MAQLARTLGVIRSTGIGVASMLGAGVFFVWAPAFALVGSWLLVALAIAATVATLNALVTTQLAIAHPSSGGIYAFGRHYRGPLTGFVAGWMFLTGKTASVAAIALVAASYLWPDNPRPVAAGLLLAGTALIASGIRSSATVTLVLAGIVVVGLVALIIAPSVGSALPALDSSPDNPLDVLTAAGLIFFAFAGYARMATLGEEVVSPRRTLPRAIGWALAIVLVLYGLIGWVMLGVLPGAGDGGDTPLRLLVTGEGSQALTVLVVLACTGSLVAVLAGLSRTAFALGRNDDLPKALAFVSPRTGGPLVAELAIGVLAVVAVLFLDVTSLVALSGAGVLTYYAIGHWSALKQERSERIVPPVVPVVGGLLCVVLVVTLPWQSVALAAASAVLGIGLFGLRRWRARRSAS
jgi:basic amino acid/polyamine antiporter, APA family